MHIYGKLSSIRIPRQAIWLPSIQDDTDQFLLTIPLLAYHKHMFGAFLQHPKQNFIDYKLETSINKRLLASRVSPPSIFMVSLIKLFSIGIPKQAIWLPTYYLICWQKLLIKCLYIDNSHKYSPYMAVKEWVNRDVHSVSNLAYIQLCMFSLILYPYHIY